MGGKIVCVVPDGGRRGSCRGSGEEVEEKIAFCSGY